MPAIPHAVCTGCGCMCDDIEVHTDRTRVIRAVNACPMGEEHFKQCTTEQINPAALIDGRPATLESAIDKAADYLTGARHPLICGLDAMTCEAQRSAILLAEKLRGAVDCQASPWHGATELALQLGGNSSATLGEVKNRADLVLCWRVNPVELNPRLFERYALFPKGMFIPHGRSDRTLAVVDYQRTPTAEIADLFLQINPEKDFEVITIMRTLLKNRPLNESSVAETGLRLNQLRDLAGLMKRARFGVIFFGMDLSMGPGKHMNAQALMALCQELNEFARFASIPIPVHGNAAGTHAVMTWMTTYPFGVDFSRGRPRYNPGEFTAADLLMQGEADAVLMSAADDLDGIPEPAFRQLSQIPSIILSPRVSDRRRCSRVHITTAVTGISAGGTVYRMDEVPLQLRPVLPSSYPADEQALERLHAAVDKKLRNTDSSIEHSCMRMRA